MSVEEYRGMRMSVEECRGMRMSEEELRGKKRSVEKEECRGVNLLTKNRLVEWVP